MTHAREVFVPINFDLELVRQALIEQVYTSPDRTARVWDDGTGCNELVLSDPQLEVRDGALFVTTHGEGRAAWGLFRYCVLPIEWQGTIEVEEEPALEPHAPVIRFRVVDSNIYGAEGQKQATTGVVWDWVKDYVHPALDELRLDLGAPIRELKDVVPDFLPHASAERIRALLDSISLDNVRATEGAIEVVVRLDVPEPPAPQASASPEPALSEAEVVALEQALDRFDAFVTFIVKFTGEATAIEEIRRALFDVLMEERYEIEAALTDPARAGPDQVRELFAKTWVRLAPVLRRIAPTLPAPVAARYVGFISAGDALHAIDEIGPSAGVEITADGLRRLARIIAPAAPGDPLAHGDAVDPELRELFGFGPALPPPEDIAEPGESEKATPAPSPSPSPGPAAPSPDPGATAVPTALESIGERAFGIARALAGIVFDGPAVAGAATASPSPSDDGGIGDGALHRLNRWTPTSADLNEYLPLVRELLRAVAEERLRAEPLAPPYAAVYRRLVPAAAWQESCWRQFVTQNGQLVPLRSRSGSVGILQVNLTVWRGFYDVKGLRGDMRYNARAGGEILSQYLRNEVIGGSKTAGNADPADLASATYAVYNGGPGQLRRLRTGKAAAGERAVDRAFRDKFAKLRGDDPLVVKECFAVANSA